MNTRVANNACPSQPPTLPLAATPAKALLTVTELMPLARALNTLMDVASTLGMRPGLIDEGVCTRAGIRFDDLVDKICDEYLDVMAELRDANPLTRRETEDRGCELLSYDLGCNQDTTDVALGTVRRAFPGRY